MSVDDDDEAARARALALIEATHQFPGAYDFTVIAHNRDAVGEALAREAAASHADPTPPRHETRPSSGGRYLSHRLSVHLVRASDVLDLYARLRAVDGVVTVL